MDIQSSIGRCPATEDVALTYVEKKLNQNLDSYAGDFRNLFELKSVLLNELVDDGRSKSNGGNLASAMREGQLSDGRRMRRIYPHGTKRLQQALLAGGDEDSSKSTLFFVGFFGTRLPNNQLTENVLTLLWDTDDHLINELVNHPDILAYASSEIAIGENWFNLVVLSSADAVERWRDAQGHDVAVRDASPVYYARVRIHVGRLSGGLVGAQFDVQRTTFVDYVDYPSRGLVYHQVKPWLDEPSSLVNVAQ